MKKISKGISETVHDGMRIFATHTKAKDVVSIEGSILGGWSMLPSSKSEVPGLAADLFDAGTSKKSKDQIREALASRGATISYSVGKNRTFFSVSCLPEDISFVLKLVVECLSESNFPVAEIKKSKERALADLEEEKNQTGPIAAAALSRLIYDSSHPNYTESLAARKKKIESVTQKDLLTFKKMLGKNGLILAITGDISEAIVTKEAKNIFGKLPKSSAIPVKSVTNKKIQKGLTELIHVKDKANIDVYMGISVPFTYDDPRYIPFIVMSEMLGGRGFTSHLMQTIRERDGLTYGVYAYAVGFGEKTDGYFQVWATFSPAKFSESVRALKKEIEIFLTKRITTENLELRKIEMSGKYVVGLSTSRALANTLQKIGIEEKSITYLDEYLEILKKVTIDDIKNAAKLISVKNLSLAAAGSFFKDA
jgi:zinc protease